MDTVNEKLSEFLLIVDDHYQNFIVEINDFLTRSNCKCVIKDAKSGLTVPYVLNSNRRTLATFVSRKTGIKLRIFPEHISQYTDFLNTLPDKMKKEIKKSSVCKRLIDPNDCNPKCVMGYDFFIDNEHYQKCRYMAFLPTLSDENNPYIKAFLEKELNFKTSSKLSK
jgi:hypothetical protein